MTNYTELYMWGPLGADEFGCLSTSENTTTPTEDVSIRVPAPLVQEMDISPPTEAVVTRKPPKKAKRRPIPDQLIEMSAEWLCFSHSDIPQPTLELSKVMRHKDGAVSVRMFDVFGPIGTIKWAADHAPCHAPATVVDWRKVKCNKPKRKLTYFDRKHRNQWDLRKKAKANAKRETTIKAKREAEAKREAWAKEKATATPEQTSMQLRAAPQQLSSARPVVLMPQWPPPQQPVIEDVGTTPAASNVVEFKPRQITEPMA